MTEITQADRDAANEAQRNAMMRVGSMHEAFARHRQQAIEALQADKTKLRWEAATGRTIDEQRANLSQAMRDTGDCKLIWVNEGDLLVAALQETER